MGMLFLQKAEKKSLVNRGVPEKSLVNRGVPERR